jgi:hypothetical protein
VRYEARAFAARALAALAVFCTIAVVLLAGSAPGAAQADQDKGASEAGVQAESEAGAPETNGNGGAGKWDPPDPVDPATPPPSTTPTPASDPAPAPSDDTASGKGNGGEGAAPTGAGGKGNATDDPGPQGKTPLPAEPAQPDAAGTPSTTDQPASTPVAESLGREEGSGADRPNRIRFRRAQGAARTAATPAPTQVAGVGGTEAEFNPAPAAAAAAFERVGQAPNGGDGSANPTDRRARPNEAKSTEQGPPIIRTIPQFVDEVPPALKFGLAATGVLAFIFALASLVTTLRNRSLDRQRRDLLQEVGLLQSALLPPVPDRVGGLRTSVAYRPADGPGAGGDFYDVLPLPGGRVGFILGDVSGHGRGALARTAFMRYTLRAYLEAGLEPRVALQVAGRVIDENLGGDFATVLLAVHDPETGSLTYATAGHPAPLVVGPQPHDPVTAGSSPPIGVGVRTGLRQTTVPLVSGSVAAMFTDGLLEARTDGGLLGRDRLAELLDEMGDDATARALVDAVKKVSRVMSDDIAAVVIQPTNAATAGLFRTEQLELTSRELAGDIAERFLAACGVAPADMEAARYDARLISERFGGVILHVVFGNRLRVEVLPRNVESIEAASRRAAAVR